MAKKKKKTKIKSIKQKIDRSLNLHTWKLGHKIVKDKKKHENKTKARGVQKEDE